MAVTITISESDAAVLTTGRVSHALDIARGHVRAAIILAVDARANDHDGDDDHAQNSTHNASRSHTCAYGCDNYAAAAICPVHGIVEYIREYG